MQSPLGHVGDGPLASAMKDGHQDDRHAHFEHGDGDGYDSSTAHCHALEYDEVSPLCDVSAQYHAHDVHNCCRCAALVEPAEGSYSTCLYDVCAGR